MKREFLVEGRKVLLLDNYFNKKVISDFEGLTLELQYSQGEKSTSYDKFPKFKCDLLPENFQNGTVIGRKCFEYVQDFYAGDTCFKLKRCYVNLVNFGDVRYPHRDCEKEQDDITALYFVNKEWDYRWGGETAFYEEKDTVLSILPKPGRLIIFSGAIEHTGGVPSRICTVPRMTLAMKFERDK